MRAAISRFFGDAQGNFGTIVAISAVPVMLAAGVALDFARVSRYETRLQNAVDAAALAVAQDMSGLDDESLERLAADYLQSNLEEDDYSRVGDVDVQFDRANQSLTIVADGSMPTSFTRLAGYETLNYRVRASIRASYGALEAALVLDNTGSMSRSGKMRDLKRAAKQFVEDMIGRSGGDGSVKIAVVPFSNYVNVGTSNRNAAWISVPPDQNNPRTRWNGCAGSREYPLNLSDAGYATRVPGVMNADCAAEITPLTTDEQTLDNAINRMVPTGMTYIPAGVSWGMRVLSAQEPFSGGATEEEAEENNITKAIVLMTDGENTISKSNGLPTHEDDDEAEANRWTTEACNQAKSKGIKVYTMTFGTEVPPATAQLIRDCSSGEGFHFDASNGDQLEQAFGQIATSLSKLYLSQ